MNHWAHLAVGRLQAHPLVAVVVELLEGGFLLVPQPGHHLVAVGYLGHRRNHHDVAVVDQVFNHRGAAHLQGVERLEPALQGRADFDAVVELRHRGNFLGAEHRQRLAGGDGTHHRHARVVGYRVALAVQQFDAAGRIVPPGQIAALFQPRQVVFHHRGGTDGAGLLNFADGGGIAVDRHKFPQKVENPLPPGR